MGNNNIPYCTHHQYRIYGDKLWKKCLNPKVRASKQRCHYFIWLKRGTKLCKNSLIERIGDE